MTHYLVATDKGEFLLPSVLVRRVVSAAAKVHVTKQILVDKLNIGRMTLYRWELGKNIPPIEKIEELLKLEQEFIKEEEILKV